MINHSPLSKKVNLRSLYNQKPLPIFQNKVYSSEREARNSLKRSVTLMQCLDTGFVFNASFDPEILSYDQDYNNEQSNSSIFQGHMLDVIGLLQKKELLNGKVLEVGCGKGYFLNLLQEKGVDIHGIDPTYEGDNSRIIKDYFSSQYSYLKADLIILRHTLEHIFYPLEFLNLIAECNNYSGYIYIEVPTFDWIINNNAVEDIFYEHCNYFDPGSISTMFNNCSIEYLFNYQYIGVVAKLTDIRKSAITTNEFTDYKVEFDSKILKYQDLVNQFSDLAIWGAGGKGSSFLNLIDPDLKRIKAVIDINPFKQNKFVGGTGHPIIAPDNIGNHHIENIITMNNIYLQEISKLTNKNLICL
ncbi:MAG: methyltransferase domain-containing protein [Saprospiraceae bacterium]|jgi:SAM-dependent methyltransferase|nr:methyltransferase domain-containing protein [Saprospiraceae bacterium]MBX7164195.1 methyltransferase domain-containing protein [Saprospiraceae bacterium]